MIVRILSLTASGFLTSLIVLMIYKLQLWLLPFGIYGRPGTRRGIQMSSTIRSALVARFEHTLISSGHIFANLYRTLGVYPVTLLRIGLRRRQVRVWLHLMQQFFSLREGWGQVCSFVIMREVSGQLAGINSLVWPHRLR